MWRANPGREPPSRCSYPVQPRVVRVTISRPDAVSALRANTARATSIRGAELLPSSARMDLATKVNAGEKFPSPISLLRTEKPRFRGFSSNGGRI